MVVARSNLIILFWVIFLLFVYMYFRNVAKVFFFILGSFRRLLCVFIMLELNMDLKYGEFVRRKDN